MTLRQRTSRRFPQHGVTPDSRPAGLRLRAPTTSAPGHTAVAQAQQRVTRLRLTQEAALVARRKSALQAPSPAEFFTITTPRSRASRRPRPKRWEFRLRLVRSRVLRRRLLPNRSSVDSADHSQIRPPTRASLALTVR